MGLAKIEIYKREGDAANTHDVVVIDGHVLPEWCLTKITTKEHVGEVTTVQLTFLARSVADVLVTDEQLDKIRLEP